MQACLDLFISYPLKNRNVLQLGWIQSKDRYAANHRVLVAYIYIYIHLAYSAIETILMRYKWIKHSPFSMCVNVSHSNQRHHKVKLDGNRLYSFRHAFKTCLFILYMAAVLRSMVKLCFSVSYVQTSLQIYFTRSDSYFTHHQPTTASLPGATHM